MSVYEKSQSTVDEIWVIEVYKHIQEEVLVEKVFAIVST